MGRKLIAPENAPVGTTCRRIFIPDDPLILAAVNGALARLMEPDQWEQLPGGNVTPDDMAALMEQMYYAYLDDECP